MGLQKIMSKSEYRGTLPFKIRRYKCNLAEIDQKGNGETCEKCFGLDSNANRKHTAIPLVFSDKADDFRASRHHTDVCGLR